MGFLVRSLLRTYVFLSPQDHTTIIHIRTPLLSGMEGYPTEEILMKSHISHIKINMDITYRNRAPTPIELPAPAVTVAAEAAAVAAEAVTDTAAAVAEAVADETKKTV